MKNLSFKTKFFYGIGFSARGIKDGLFQIFLFFYFSQVLGLDPKLAGIASLLGLVFDAVSDPIVGFISDNWQSKKWGRRHPFMFMAALPLGLFTWLLFMPPQGLGQSGLFWWLASFSILLRLALTVYVVPFISLGAELSTDYDERTSITAMRIMFAAFISPVIMIVGFIFFFRKTEGISHGLFNVDAYPWFALLCAVLMVLFILLSAWNTRDIIPDLPRASEKQLQKGNSEFFRSLKLAFSMRSFLTLVLFITTIYIGIGVGIIFSTYFETYFFEFSETEMAALPIGSAVGGVMSLVLAPLLGRLLDKRKAAIISTILFGILFTLPFNLRLMDAFPANGSPLLLPLYVGTLILAYCFLWVAFSLGNSMMAEVVDEFELQTGKRQEGLFFAFMSFAFKSATGVGSFLAGILLAWIAFPTQAEVGQVATEAIRGLGVVGGRILLFFYIGSIIFILFYPIDKNRYTEIRKQLDAR